MAQKKKNNKKLKNSKRPISITSLIKRTSFEVSTFWKPLLGVTTVYAILQFFLVMGLSFSSTLQDELLFSEGKVGSVFGDVFSAINASVFIGNSQSDAAALVQWLLLVVYSMAIVWTLRKLQAVKNIRIRDAYYSGTDRIIPVFITSMVLLVMLIPLFIGSSIFTVMLQSGSSQTETIVVAGVCGLLLLTSAYLFAMYWPALYIVSLPNNYPISALKAARKITKKLRFKILASAVAFITLVFAALIIILIPFALVASGLVPAIVFVYCMLALSVGHTYFYNLYRDLL